MTTVDKVQAIASHLKKVSPEALEVYIDDASEEVDDLKVKDKYKERLTRYLAAHLATMNVRREDSRSFEGASVSYSSESAGTGLDSTGYGQEFQRILRKAQGLRLKVI